MLNISAEQLMSLAQKDWRAQRLREAEALCRQLVGQAKGPQLLDGSDMLGRIVLERGRPVEAVAIFRQILEQQPDRREVQDLFLMALHALPESTPESLFGWHAQWGRRFAGLGRVVHANERNAEKRLRIGYVSQDFKIQPLGVFMQPLLKAHDRAKVEVFCYSSVRVPDQVTAQLQAAADRWRNIADLSDEQAAGQIRADGIDILVDLSLHSLGNRLPVFARKPAPVQATFLGYSSTTGLEAIDWRITDPYLEPPSEATSEATREKGGWSAERPIQLPRTYWSYQPIIATPEVNALPAAGTRRVTFASMNNLSKVSEGALVAWCAIMRAVPESHLLIHAREKPRSAWVDALVEREGIDPGRVATFGYVSVPDYFSLYAVVDIALDSFPWSGGTTTCDALWMGVPVVTLAGRTAVGRGGVSILSNVGLPELVVHTPEAYVEIAVGLAKDLPRLAGLRAGLRERIQHSPVMDIAAYARDLEGVYRELWKRWCEGKVSR